MMSKQRRNLYVFYFFFLIITMSRKNILHTSFSLVCDVNPESSDKDIAFTSKLLLLISGKCNAEDE